MSKSIDATLPWWRNWSMYASSGCSWTVILYEMLSAPSVNRSDEARCWPVAVRIASESSCTESAMGFGGSISRDRRSNVTR
jgi:hypothetical protein